MDDDVNVVHEEHYVYLEHCRSNSLVEFNYHLSEQYLVSEIISLETNYCMLFTK